MGSKLDDNLIVHVESKHRGYYAGEREQRDTQKWSLKRHLNLVNSPWFSSCVDLMCTGYISQVSPVKV